MLFAVLCIIAFILFIVHQFLDTFILSLKLDGPFAWPLIGNAMDFVDIKGVANSFDSYAKKFKSPFRIWLGPKLVVVIADAENAELVLKSKDCLNKSMVFYNAVIDAINTDGLITLKAEHWRVHRRVVSPVLNESSIRSHLSDFNKIIKETIMNLQSDNKPFDLYKHVTKCTMRMFVQAALGDTMDPKLRQRYLDAFTRGIEITSTRFYHPLYLIESIWRFTKEYKELSAATKLGHYVVSDMLKQKINKGFDGISFIDKLFEVSSKVPSFTHDDVKSETGTLLLGATDSTANTSSTLALMLALHPDVQERLFEEVLSVMPTKDTTLTEDSLNKLKFMDNCLNESYRVFATVPIIAREPSQPITLKNGVTIPTGTPIAIAIRQLHLKEEYWGPTAHLYDPTRFEREEFKKQPAGSFIPFSYGPRNCVGTNYAKIAVKSYVAHLVRNYQMRTPYKSLKDLKMVQTVSTRFEDGHMIQLEPRD